MGPQLIAPLAANEKRSVRASNCTTFHKRGYRLWASAAYFRMSQSVRPVGGNNDSSRRLRLDARHHGFAERFRIGGGFQFEYCARSRKSGRFANDEPRNDETSNRENP